MFRILFVYLLLYAPYMQNLKKRMIAMLLLVQNWDKTTHLPQQQGLFWKCHIYWYYVL